MQAAAAAEEFASLAYPVLMALGVAMARSLGLLVMSPAFTRLGITNMLRSAVAFAISLPLVPPLLAAGVLDGETSAAFIIALTVKEFIIGATLGLVFGLPFWAAEMAGDLIDLQRGSTMGQLVDPLSMQDSSVSATLLSVISIAIFFASGGFLDMLNGFYSSYEVWPAERLAPVFNVNVVLFSLGLLDNVLYYSVVLAFPVLAAVLLCDLVLAYLARTAPQMHIFDTSLSVKALVFSIIIVVYSGFFVLLAGDVNRAADTDFRQITDG